MKKKNRSLGNYNKKLKKGYYYMGDNEWFVMTDTTAREGDRYHWIVRREEGEQMQRNYQGYNIAYRGSKWYCRQKAKELIEYIPYED